MVTKILKKKKLRKFTKEVSGRSVKIAEKDNVLGLPL